MSPDLLDKPNEKQVPDEGSMSLLDHLRELRNALIYSLVSIAIFSGVMLYFAGDIFRILSLPIMEVFANSGNEQRLIFTSPPEGFITYIKVGLFAGLMSSTPFWMFFMGRFVWLGLRNIEKKFLMVFVGGGSLLFVVGGAFGYFKIFPLGLNFLITNYQSEFLQAFITIKEYFSFAVKLIIAFGLAFELPLVMLILGRLGLVSARQFIRASRWAIVIIFIVAAILTPPDVITQIGLAIPLCLLYITGIALVALFGKRKPAAVETDEAENGA